MQPPKPPPPALGVPACAPALPSAASGRGRPSARRSPRPSGPVAAPPAPLLPRLRSSLTASFWNPVVSSFPQQTPVPPPPDSPHQTLASDLSWGTEGQPGVVTAGQAGQTISSFTGAWTPGPEGGEAGVWTPGSEGGGAGGLDPGSGVWTLALRRVWGLGPWLWGGGRVPGSGRSGCSQFWATTQGVALPLVSPGVRPGAGLRPPRWGRVLLQAGLCWHGL